MRVDLFFFGNFGFPVGSTAKAGDPGSDASLKQAGPKKDADSRNMRGRDGRRD